ncbi:MAG: hypothetical protein ACI8VW_002442 [bacterium]
MRVQQLNLDFNKACAFPKFTESRLIGVLGGLPIIAES